MRIFFNRVNETNREFFDVPDRSRRVRIGSGADNEIVLDHERIANRAMLLRKRPEGWELTAIGTTAGKMDDGWLQGGKTILVDRNMSISLFPYKLDFHPPADVDPDERAQRQQLDNEMSELMLKVHLDLLNMLDLRVGAEPARVNDNYILALEKNLDAISQVRGITARQRKALATHIAGHAVRSKILEDVLETAQQIESILISDGRWRQLLTQVPQLEKELDQLAADLASRMEINETGELSRRIDIIEVDFWNVWKSHSSDLLPESRIYLARRYIKKQIKDIVFGSGPLEDLLRIPSISEIMVVDSERIYIEKAGRLENSGRRFVSDEVTLAIIERIVSRVGRRIDKSQPLVDARLQDGSRVNAIISPLAVSGPSLTIRRFPERRPRIDDLVERYGSLTETVAKFLHASVYVRKNILISGGTGTGKTTLLNVLSDFIPDRERVVTIEDTAELQLAKEHVVRLESKQANIEGTGEYTIRDLVKNALRMRPDRIVVGECRGGEALDMLQAMNTGHDGSLTTIHANSATDVILRLEVLVQMAAQLPIESIHRQIASAIDLIVQLHRLRDGRRVVAQITEIMDYDEQNRELQTKDLFVLTGPEGDRRLTATGRMPTFMGELIESEMIDLDSFYL